MHFHSTYLYTRSTPHPVTVTTRIITYLVGNPYKPSFATVTGWGVDPTSTLLLNLKMYVIRQAPAPSSFYKGVFLLPSKFLQFPRWVISKTESCSDISDIRFLPNRSCETFSEIRGSLKMWRCLSDTFGFIIWIWKKWRWISGIRNGARFQVETSWLESSKIRSLVSTDDSCCGVHLY